jgi:hypothetical protein
MFAAFERPRSPRLHKNGRLGGQIAPTEKKLPQKSHFTHFPTKSLKKLVLFFRVPLEKVLVADFGHLDGGCGSFS